MTRIVILVLALVGAACSGELAELDQAAAETSAPTTVSSESASESTAVQPESTTTSERRESVGESPATPDIAADRSPPTTETAGLASNVETAEVSGELTCWRVEDFGEEALERWRVINDGVMGGLSVGELSYSGGVATFDGTINTDGGGFSMIRTSVLRGDGTLAEQLAGAEYLRFRIRSANGRGYELTVQDGSANTSIMHFTDIAVTNDGAWQESVVPLTELEARAFGTPRPDLEAFDLGSIATLGVILADGRDGPFSIALDRIDACRAA